MPTTIFKILSLSRVHRKFAIVITKDTTTSEKCCYTTWWTNLAPFWHILSNGLIFLSSCGLKTLSGRRDWAANLYSTITKSRMCNATGFMLWHFLDTTAFGLHSVFLHFTDLVKRLLRYIVNPISRALDQRSFLWTTQTRNWIIKSCIVHIFCVYGTVLCCLLMHHVLYIRDLLKHQIIATDRHRFNGLSSRTTLESQHEKA